jgi:hypothetical protein
MGCKIQLPTFMPPMFRHSFTSTNCERQRAKRERLTAQNRRKAGAYFLMICSQVLASRR